MTSHRVFVRNPGDRHPRCATCGHPAPTIRDRQAHDTQHIIATLMRQT